LSWEYSLSSDGSVNDDLDTSKMKVAEIAFVVISDPDGNKITIP
jgi:hypothetical protein